LKETRREHPIEKGQTFLSNIGKKVGTRRRKKTGETGSGGGDKKRRGEVSVPKKMVSQSSARNWKKESSRRAVKRNKTSYEREGDATSSLIGGKGEASGAQRGKILFLGRKIRKKTAGASIVDGPRGSETGGSGGEGKKKKVFGR